MDVLARLEYRVEPRSHDIEASLHHIWTMPRSSQDRAMSLIESHQLHTWLASRKSSALFVNGNHDASAQQSPLTYVCARLVDTIYRSTAGRYSRYSLVLKQTFFCGLHLKMDEPVAGPIGMMRSLVLQLIKGYNACSMPMVGRQLDINSFNFDDLCHTFTVLIRQLPP